MHITNGKGKTGYLIDWRFELQCHLPPATINSDNGTHLGIHHPAAQHWNEHMVGTCKRKFALRSQFYLWYRILQGSLQYHGSGYSMSHLVGRQQMGILLEHLSLQHLHIAYSFIHLIGQCC